MAIMNQEALREGNNIGRLMMMNRFGKTPADLTLPSPLPLQPLPELLMQNKMKKKKIYRKRLRTPPGRSETMRQKQRMWGCTALSGRKIPRWISRLGRIFRQPERTFQAAEAETSAGRAQHAIKCFFFLYKTQRIHAKVMKQDGDMRAQPSSLEYQSSYLQKEKWEFKKKK